MSHDNSGYRGRQHLSERRASYTATLTMTMAPSKIHSHRSEEADPLDAGDGEDAVGDSEGGSVNGEGAG